MFSVVDLKTTIMSWMVNIYKKMIVQGLSEGKKIWLS